ncbi:MAG: hypothetical protein ACK5O2_00600 [Microthrixaceae bacterium]
MKVVVDWPDVERLIVDLIDGFDIADSVGIGVPKGWTPGAGVHAQVALDGTTTIIASVMQRHTVRVTVWADQPTTAKLSAARLQGHLHAHPGGDGITAIKPLTGSLPARDPDTGAELASFTVAVVVRSTP